MKIIRFNEFLSKNLRHPHVHILSLKFVRIGFHAVGGGRWIVKWRLDGDEMETMRGTDRSIGPRKPSPQMSTLHFYIFQNCLQIWK